MSKFEDLNIQHSFFNIPNNNMNNEQRPEAEPNGAKLITNIYRPNQIVVVKQRRKVQEQCSKTRKYDERLALRTSFRGSFQDGMIQA
jgi:hypothetical protein